MKKILEKLCKYISESLKTFSDQIDLGTYDDESRSTKPIISGTILQRASDFCKNLVESVDTQAGWKDKVDSVNNDLKEKIKVINNQERIINDLKFKEQRYDQKLEELEKNYKESLNLNENLKRENFNKDRQFQDEKTLLDNKVGNLADDKIKLQFQYSSALKSEEEVKRELNNLKYKYGIEIPALRKAIASVKQDNNQLKAKLSNKRLEVLTPLPGFKKDKYVEPSETVPEINLLGSQGLINTSKEVKKKS